MDDKFRVSRLKHCYVVIAVAHGASVAAGAVSHLNIEGGVAHYENPPRGASCRGGPIPYLARAWV